MMTLLRGHVRVNRSLFAVYRNDRYIPGFLKSDMLMGSVMSLSTPFNDYIANEPY